MAVRWLSEALQWPPAQIDTQVLRIAFYFIYDFCFPLMAWIVGKSKYVLYEWKCFLIKSMLKFVDTVGCLSCCQHLWCILMCLGDWTFVPSGLLSLSWTLSYETQLLSPSQHIYTYIHTYLPTFSSLPLYQLSRRVTLRRKLPSGSRLGVCARSRFSRGELLNFLNFPGSYTRPTSI